MGSPWQVPLPLGKHTSSRVVVYFYSGSWIPIMFYSLADAIKLHHQALSSGKELFVFPADLDPGTFNAPSTQPIGLGQGITDSITTSSELHLTASKK